MQLKINFLCCDSILAAPIVLDVALFLIREAFEHAASGMAVVLF
jgi:hypothetical protein